MYICIITMIDVSGLYNMAGVHESQILEVNNSPEAVLC